MNRMGADGEEEAEEDEDIDLNEVQRRKERLEREQWLREQVWRVSLIIHHFTAAFVFPSMVAGPYFFLSSQSEQKAKKVEDLDVDDEKIGDEDSHFMKLAKKLTAKTLQKKGWFDTKLNQWSNVHNGSHCSSMLDLFLKICFFIKLEPPVALQPEKKTSALNPFQRPSQHSQVAHCEPSLLPHVLVVGSIFV